jgi:hypothetical protein
MTPITDRLTVTGPDERGFRRVTINGPDGRTQHAWLDYAEAAAMAEALMPKDKP